MTNRIYLFWLLMAVLLIIVFSFLFSIHNDNEKIDNLFLDVCTPQPTYYSIKNIQNSSYPISSSSFVGKEKDCKRFCAFSDTCIGYLVSDDQCYIYNNDDIGTNVSIQYNCKYPTQSDIKTTLNIDSWRKGAWKKDYPFDTNLLTKNTSGQWNLCDDNPQYWLINPKGDHTPKELTSPECFSSCEQTPGCLGWQHNPTNIGYDGICRHYYDIKNLSPSNFTYSCSKGNAYNEGGWLTKYIPPDLFRRIYNE